VHVLSSVYFEAALILFVRNGVPSHATNHHLVTRHEIVHNIFQLRHQCLLVDKVEKDELISSYLYPDVALDEIYKPSHVNRVIVYPIVSLIEMVPLLFEEEDFT
jgi:hypothetical protein